MTADDPAAPVRRAHCGPIEPGCPVGCLQTVVSLMAFNRLAWAYDPPRTVGDVVELCQQGKLGEIRSLGPRRISEIQAALVFAGLDIYGHQHR